MLTFLGVILTIVHAVLATVYIAQSGQMPPPDRLIFKPIVAWPVAIISFFLLQKILRECGINVFEGTVYMGGQGPY